MLASRRAPILIAAVLAALLLAQGARLGLMLSEPPTAGALSGPTATTDRAILARFDPFFRGAAPPAAATDAGGWTLFAVRAGGGSFDTAILAGADGRQALYRVGEAPAPGLILDSVAADHVILSGGGRPIRVDFAAGASPAPTAAPIVAPPVSPAAEDGAAPTLSPSRFMAETALSPRVRDGRTSGLTLQPRGGGATLSALGLQPGDVLVSVNGAAIDNPERAADLALELGAGATAQLEIERGGVRRALAVRIDAQDR